MSMYQEALERIDYSLEIIDCMTSEQRRSLGAVSYAIEANLDYIKEVLPKIASKEILKKPERSTFCPRCNEYLDEMHRYCPGCGQRIDWRDNNE